MRTFVGGTGFPACDGSLYISRATLSEGVDKVAERDAAGGKDAENSGTGVPACRAARASWLAQHLRAITVPAMPTNSAHQRPAFPWVAVARAKKARASSTGRDACPTDSDTPTRGQPEASGFANSVTTACKKREDHSENVETPGTGFPACHSFVVHRCCGPETTGWKACPTQSSWLIDFSRPRLPTRKGQKMRLPFRSSLPD